MNRIHRCVRRQDLFVFTFEANIPRIEHEWLSAYFIFTFFSLPPKIMFSRPIDQLTREQKNGHHDHYFHCRSKWHTILQVKQKPRWRDDTNELLCLSVRLSVCSDIHRSYRGRCRSSTERGRQDRRKYCVWTRSALNTNRVDIQAIGHFWFSSSSSLLQQTVLAKDYASLCLVFINMMMDLFFSCLIRLHMVNQQ